MEYGVWSIEHRVWSVEWWVSSELQGARVQGTGYVSHPEKSWHSLLDFYDLILVFCLFTLLFLFTFVRRNLENSTKSLFYDWVATGNSIIPTRAAVRQFPFSRWYKDICHSLQKGSIHSHSLYSVGPYRSQLKGPFVRSNQIIRT